MLKKSFFLVLFVIIAIIAYYSYQKRKDQNHQLENSNVEISSQTEYKHPAQKRLNSSTPKSKEEDTFSAGGLNWLTVEQAGALKNIDNKKFLIDVYTDWCGYCKVMDRVTFTDKAVKEYLEANFHLVKLNAEQKEPITFRGKKYEWIDMGRGGVNKFAKEIMNNRMSYPTLVYFDPHFNKLKSSPGYKKPDQLLAELRLLE